MKNTSATEIRNWLRTNASYDVLRDRRAAKAAGFRVGAARFGALWGEIKAEARAPKQDDTTETLRRRIADLEAELIDARNGDQGEDEDEGEGQEQEQEQGQGQEQKQELRVSGEHKDLAKVLRRVKAGFNNVFISGPAGSGKTTLAQQLAAKLGRAFGFLSLTGGVNESHLLGRVTPNLQTGEAVWTTSQFVSIFENGGVFLLDEVDAADPNVLLAVNAALANGELANPMSGKTHQRHADTVIICAANTWGTGATAEYCGRNRLDSATLSRFIGAMIEVTFDTDLEKMLAGVAGNRADEITTLVWSMRASAARNGLQRDCGTRMVIAAAKLAAAGFNRAEMIDALTAGWSQEERSMAGLR